jgi:outer membrane protein TolC
MLIAILISLIGQGPAGDTTDLTLAAARQRALAVNPTLRAERANARAAAAGPREASRAFLPTLSADAQAVRSTDPVAVFGMKLRQSAFTAGDLSLGALNDPAPYTDYTARVGVELPLFNLEGWYRYAAAGRAASAQAAAARRAAGATILAVSRHGHAGFTSGAGGGDWTVGVGLQWRLFPGLAGAGAIARARAEQT